MTTIAIPGLGFCSLMNVCYNLVYSWFILCFSLTNWAMLETFFSHKTTWGQVLQIIYKLLKQVTFDKKMQQKLKSLIVPLPGQLWWLIGVLYILCFFLQIMMTLNNKSSLRGGGSMEAVGASCPHKFWPDMAKVVFALTTFYQGIWTSRNLKGSCRYYWNCWEHIKQWKTMYILGSPLLEWSVKC